MLILHTSDWHLGRTLHRADLTPAFELWCQHVVELVKERGIDAVLISGDVYDRGVPSTTAVTLFDATLSELSQLTTVIMTSGNHDSAQRLGFGSALMQDRIHIRTDSRCCGDPVEVRAKDGSLGALVYPIPYLDPDVERRRLASNPDDSGTYLDRSHEAVLRAALKRIEADAEGGEHAGADIARICMAHAFVTGAEASESERDIHVGGVDSVPSGLFRLGAHGDATGPLTYVALGHLHSPQSVGLEWDPPMRYSGSPVAFSFSESRPKSSVLLHIEGSTVTTELIPAPVWKQVVTLEGPLELILSEPNRRYATSFVRCIVTNPARPRDMAAQIRSVFPDALEIQHRPEASVPPASSIPIASRDPFEVVGQFMEVAGNKEITPIEHAVLRDAWESARAQHFEAGGK